jgi:pimeloyl-ACP methyl ester carboxylesterase
LKENPAVAEGASFAVRQVATARHTTVYLDSGPADGPLMVFVHGWPELGIVWRAQIEHFAAAGWRGIAPDMRGYGNSPLPKTTSAFAMQELVAARGYRPLADRQDLRRVDMDMQPVSTKSIEIHHRMVDVQGLKIFYREAGPANTPVILLLHGWPASSVDKGDQPAADTYSRQHACASRSHRRHVF